MKNLYLVFVFIAIIIVSGCGNNSEGSTNPESTNNQETIEGSYSYSDNSVQREITISGNRWIGKTIIVTGFGSKYDNQNSVQSSGIIKGNDLYDNSGMIKIGYVSGERLTTSISGKRITLIKD